MKKQKTQTQAEKKKKRKVLRITLLVFMALVALFFLSKCCIDVNTVKAPESTRTYLSDDGNSLDGEAKTTAREEILKELEKQQLIVTDRLSSNITFSSGDIGTVGEWIIENPEDSVENFEFNIVVPEFQLEAKVLVF